MVAYRMLLTLPAHIPASRAKTTFYWTAQGRSSIEATYGPRLGGLGPVLQPNVEFVRVAGAIFAADRSTPRQGGGSNWNQRDIKLSVPVINVPRWAAIAEDLSRLIGFLSGDRWSFSFVKSASAKEPIAPRTSSPTRVVLLSGGADSAIGALLSRSQLAADEAHVLVSHVGLKNLSPIQQHVAQQLKHLLPGPGQQHLQIGFRRHEKQTNGVRFDSESSSRSRSILFLAFGLAVASLDRVPLWIPENGFASLNPPLGPERRGSLSTRTTHPYFLAELSRILTAAGAHAEIINPLAALTKGEMFTDAADLIGSARASKFLSSTHSCAHSGQRAYGISPTRQCGVCFGCVIRRSSFQAAGLTDSTDYIFPSSDPRVARWLGDKSVERSVQDLLRRGIRPRDIETLQLPPDYPASRAIDLCQRQLEELSGLFP